MKSARQPYPLRRILLRTEAQRALAIAAITNAPLDDAKPLELLLREEPKARKPDQNALMWAGPMQDIAEQGFVNGRQFSADVWHEHFKREFLPEEFDPASCKDGYRKWDITPGGERVLIGSTTQLTVSGFSAYLHKVESFAIIELGVQFRERKKAA